MSWVSNWVWAGPSTDFGYRVTNKCWEPSETLWVWEDDGGRLTGTKDFRYPRGSRHSHSTRTVSFVIDNAIDRSFLLKLLVLIKILLMTYETLLSPLLNDFGKTITSTPLTVLALSTFLLLRSSEDVNLTKNRSLKTKRKVQFLGFWSLTSIS